MERWVRSLTSDPAKQNQKGTIVPIHVSVAMKLRDGVTPEELVEKIIRKRLFQKKDPWMMRDLEEEITVSLANYGVRAQVRVSDQAKSRHGLEVHIDVLSDDS